MKNTPNSNRKHIVFYGKRNAGKSSIMNKIIGQEISLVSEIKGTTTDTVSKAMELIPFGPVVFVDTGGIDDKGDLGILRVEKTMKTLDKADLGIYIISIDDLENGLNEEFYLKFIKEFKRRNIPYIIVINKIDKVSKEKLREIKEDIIFNKSLDNLIYLSILDEKSMLNLKEELVEKLQVEEQEQSLIGDIVPYGGKIIMVVSIDSEAPRGRLILPQVQLLRDSLDHGIKSYVVRNTELKSAIEDLKDIDLVVTDSQIFKEVDKIVPKDINLTSFSILMARQKGDLNVFLKGTSIIEELKKIEVPRILIMESCSHNTSHEDIGRVKIPKLLSKYLNKEIDFQFKMGEDFPKDLQSFDLVIHCGSCMLNKRSMISRIEICKDENVPITNYGIVLAYLTGILNRSVNMFI